MTSARRSIKGPPLKVGDRVIVYGGYDMDPPWLASNPAGYTGEVVEFIPGQDSDPAAVVALDQELVLPEGAGATRGNRRRGTFLVLELGHVGADWSTPTPRVHVELCDERPEPTPWQDRRRGHGSSRTRPPDSRADRLATLHRRHHLEAVDRRRRRGTRSATGVCCGRPVAHAAAPGTREGCASISVDRLRHADRVSDSWSCLHFSLANPRDDGATDLPLLLRRLADAIEEREIEAMDVLDLTVSHEITEDGPWWSATVYWSPQGTTASGQ